MIIGVIIGCLEVKWAILMLVCLIVVNFLASSLNSLITSIYPIFMRGKVDSGFYAGMLNGFCYLGSTISAYGLGYIAGKDKKIFVTKHFNKLIYKKKAD